MSEVITGSSLADRAAQLAIDGVTLGREGQLILAKHFIALRAALAEAQRDAERYKLIRSLSWYSADLCVVTNPRSNVKLGSDCPSGVRLDEKLDAILATKEGRSNG